MPTSEEATYTQTWPYDQQCLTCGQRVGASKALVLVRSIPGRQNRTRLFCLGHKKCLEHARLIFLLHKQTTTAWTWAGWPKGKPERFEF